MTEKQDKIDEIMKETYTNLEKFENELPLLIYHNSETGMEIEGCLTLPELKIIYEALKKITKIDPVEEDRDPETMEEAVEIMRRMRNNK